MKKEEIKRLALEGKLFWEGKKIVLDPFIEVEYFYEADAQEDGSIIVRGILRTKGKESAVEKCEALFPSSVIEGSIARFFKDPINPKWLIHKPQRFEKERKISFLKDCEERIVWKNILQRKDSLPVLILKDRSGAFTDLWIEDEEGRREMTLQDRCWEQDLLETDFIRKKVDSTNYYCPLDKVAKSLTFLLEMGWTILDFRGKRVVLQGKIDLFSSAAKDRVLLQGKIKYGEYEVDVAKVVGAFNRKDRFLDLSEDRVGLIELPAVFNDLAEEDIVPQGIAVRRAHIGLLEGIVFLPEGFQIADWKTILPGPDFHGTLYPYQQSGVDFLSFLYRSSFHGLLADEMGLGKTIQILAFLSTLRSPVPILIVMPTSLLFNWKQEILRFLPSKMKDITLASYAFLRQNIDLFQQTEYEAVILDEAQVIKNPESQIAGAVRQLKSRFRLAVTGTPIENRWEDLKSIFTFLMQGSLDLSPIPERAQKQIRPFTLRRKKEEVALDLPEKQEQIVWVEFQEEQRMFYDNYLKETQTEKMGSFEVFEAILRLRQICSHPHLVRNDYGGKSAKLERLFADLEEVIEGGAKVLVYSQFTTMLRLIEKEVVERKWNYVYLDGKTRDREKAVAQFQEDPQTQIFLISLKAGGVGLNLTAADYVFLFDPWWNEAVEAQAISRAHRLGRKKPVIARRYLAAETIEEKILKLKEKKLALVQGVLDFEEELKALSLHELKSLLDPALDLPQ